MKVRLAILRGSFLYSPFILGKRGYSRLPANLFVDELLSGDAVLNGETVESSEPCSTSLSSLPIITLDCEMSGVLRDALSRLEYVMGELRDLARVRLS